jgi:hypothetical protein
LFYTDKGFQRFSYQLLDESGKAKDTPVVVHYSGDEALSAEAPHGNATRSRKPFERTPQSVLDYAKSTTQSKTASKTYRAAPPELQLRNLKQAQNMRYAANKNKRITTDDIINVHMQHVQLGYPNSIRTAPDLVVIGVDSELLQEAKVALKAAKALNVKVEIQYDTTFNLAPYYVSVLVLVHPLLNKVSTKQPPSIPLFQLFHEKKHEDAHLEFWSFVKKVLIKNKLFKKCNHIHY